MVLEHERKWDANEAFAVQSLWRLIEDLGFEAEIVKVNGGAEINNAQALMARKYLRHKALPQYGHVFQSAWADLPQRVHVRAGAPVPVR